MVAPSEVATLIVVVVGAPIVVFFYLRALIVRFAVVGEGELTREHEPRDLMVFSQARRIRYNTREDF